MLEKNKIVFFDGVCNYCNATVNFVLKNNKDKDILFCPLQSSKAEMFLTNMNENPKALNTIYYYSSGRIYKKSKAVLMIFKSLSLSFNILAFLGGFFPTIISDKIYDIIAQNRYKIMGKRTECRIPNESEKSRFIQ